MSQLSSSVEMDPLNKKLMSYTARHSSSTDELGYLGDEVKQLHRSQDTNKLEFQKLHYKITNTKIEMLS